MKRISIIFCCICVSMFAFTTQSIAQKNALVAADQSFRNMEYADAIDLYKKAYTDMHGNGKKNEKARIIFQIGECYRMMNESKQEEQWYAKAIKAKYADPIAILYMADAQKKQGNYDDAITSYNQYKEAVPSDQRGDAGVKSCQEAAKLKNNPTRYVVTNLAQINTKYEDFGACFADRRYDEVFFTSARPGSTGDKIDNGLGQTSAISTKPRLTKTESGALLYHFLLRLTAKEMTVLLLSTERLKPCISPVVF